MKSKFPSEKSEMSSVSTASLLLRGVAPTGRNIKATIATLASRFGWGHGRTRGIWYEDARRIDADEMDALRREACERAARNEALARAMESTDPGFYRPEIAALRDAARSLRRLAAAPGTEPD